MFYAKRVAKTVDIMQWHYDMPHGISPYNDHPKEPCAYYGCHDPSKRKCSTALRAWWCVVKLLVLVQSSSAAAERVFSLLKAFFSHLQLSTNTDVIRTTLFLASNKRAI